MNNLLPRSTGRADQASKTISHLSSWQPEKADPRVDKNIPYGLDIEIKEDAYEEKYVVNSPPKAEPNKRDLHSSYNEVEPSPLCASERGVAEIGRIVMPKEDKSEFGGTLVSKAEKEPMLFISVCNLLASTCLDMFMQRASSMKTLVLHPNMQCTRNLSQKAGEVHPDYVDKNPLSISFATLEQASVTMTGRHEVRNFEFVPGPIGMEVELKYDRLLCTKVLPGAQAFKYAEFLDGVEIVAVNGIRVRLLEEFQDAVIAAHRFGKVTITAVAYRKGVKKLENFYAQLQGNKSKTVKSLFSGLLSGGVDLDHSHGLGLPSMDDNDDDDDDDYDDEEEIDDEGENDVDGDNSSHISQQSSRADAKNDEQNESQAKYSAKDVDNQADDKHDYEYEDAKGDKNYGDADDSSDDSDDNVTSIRKKSPKQTVKKSLSNTEYIGIDNDEQQGMMAASKSRPTLQDREYDVVDEELDDFDFSMNSEYELEDEAKETAVEFEEATKCEIIACTVDVELEEEEAKEHWDYTTALEIEETVPFPRLVCVPRRFQRSDTWGDPNNFIQFVNYSAKWEVQINWVDEECSLVSRITLKPGQSCKHMELTCPSHVWCLVATLTENEGAEYDQAMSNSTIDHESGSLASSKRGDVANRSPIMMMLRPSAASLSPRKYVSMIWTPWKSVSATQRMRAKELPAHQQIKKPKVPPVIQPDIVLQIMDGSAKV